MARFILSGFADEAGESLDDQIKVFTEKGNGFIEFRSADGMGIADYTIEKAIAAKNKLHKNNIAVSALGTPIGKIDINDDFGPHLETFKHLLDLAHAMDTKYIRMFSFFIPEGEDPADYRGQVLDRLFQFTELAKKADLILLHENEKEIYGDTANRCKDLMATINSPHFRMTYDFSNFVQCGEENYPYAWNLLKEYTDYIHIKDSVYSDKVHGRDLGKQVTGNAHRTAGNGDGKLSTILEELKQRDGDIFLSIEPHLGEEYGDTPKKRFTAAADALYVLLEELKG